ncbi:hypothetical protein HNO52_11475 [Billgrantia diversa]|uniref:hypothetical protein n=1 Tax=Halomonas sp. MCCC 1A13316 TaxID=2733487 RepID=UPI0018A5B21D|nr:hypothetical protein [Halomonas sp. MCCC 1A13316]QOR39063.1 hypothetical protein HNO52_11475 [Halomonas sp. MCCC 1A13316]
MHDERPYPHEIVQEWQQAIDLSNLNLHDAQRVMQVVRYALPPLCLESLETATRFYKYDHDDNEVSIAVANLASGDEIARNQPRNLGTFYPVFYAMTNPRFLGRDKCQAASLGRRLLSDWFSELKNGTRTSRNNFYSHVLAVRHVLMAAINADWEVTDEESNPEKFFLATIESDALFKQRNDILDSYEVFVEIINGSLFPGQLIRRSSGKRNSAAGSQRTKTDPWHAARVVKLATSPPAPRRVIQGADLPGEHTEELTALGFRTVISATKGENAEPGEQVIMQRQTPSMLTPDDDRRIVQQWVASSATASLAAVSDMGRLPPEQVREVMSAALSPIERLLAILLLSTGMPVKRLLSLTVEPPIGSEMVPCTERPFWRPTTGELCYRLLDGPSANDDFPDLLWVKLRLPAVLADILSSSDYSTPGLQPFRGVRTRLNKQLLKHFRRQPGVTPTANRLSATSWLWRRPHARDDVAAKTLAGQYDLSLAAPAAYRQLSRDEIQQIFDATLADLGIISETHRDKSDRQVGGPDGTRAIMGSSVAQPPEAFLPIFIEIKEKMTAPSDEMAGWWLGRPFPHESLARLYQYVAAYHLLAWQLSTGARPVGPSSHNRISGQLQWIRDKASPRGIESRVVPLIGELQSALLHLQRWTDVLCRRLQSVDVTLVDKRSKQRSTPAWLVAPARGRRLILRDMTWSDFQSLSLEHSAGLASNVARHSLASWLRERVPDAEVDALLGHARDGRSLSAPRGEAATGQQAALRRLLKEWLNQCGYHPLAWRDLPWNS